MKKIIILLAAFLPLAWSCSPFDEAHTTEVKELAFNLKELKTASSEGGQIKIPVYASGQVSIKFVGECDWAHLSTNSINGDATLVVDIDKNVAMRRMAKIAMTLNETGLKDTICIKQEGIQAYLECQAPYLAVSGNDTDKITYILNTNINSDQIQKTIEYISGGNDWMSEFALKDQSKTTSILETVPTVNSGNQIRKARISLLHIDGWEDRHRCDLYITQSKKDGSFGSEISFEEARALGSTAGAKISEDLLINGIIISDHRSRNMDENTNTSYDVVDSNFRSLQHTS